MKVKCPFCGDMIDKRGFESHQNSYRCIARRTIKEYEQKGYVVFNGMRANNNLTKNNEVLKIIIKDITGYFWA
jgi:sarcosine oxidase delta subunit